MRLDVCAIDAPAARVYISDMSQSEAERPGGNTEVHVEVVGPFQENTFLLRAPNRREVVVIDPGDDPDVLIEAIESRELEPVAIVNTHGHIDHVSAVAPLREHFQIPFYLHSADHFLLDHLERSANSWGLPVPKTPEVDHRLEDFETLELAGLEIEARSTPGHTPGGVSLVVDGRVFAGDCLFWGSIGRTDFPGGDTQALLDSIKNQLLRLPDETIVHCGHGPDTTIGHERTHNPFLHNL